jgi:hypothetical protein
MMVTRNRDSMITMPCDIETRRTEPRRRAAWHRDCPHPDRCRCPAHERDTAERDRT